MRLRVISPNHRSTRLSHDEDVGMKCNFNTPRFPPIGPASPRLRGASKDAYAILPTMLSIVATPIGNLKDITLRAIETLKSCDAIVCEDTRVTGNLIKQLGLEKKELISMHGYSDPKKIETILDRLKRGGHLALTSDAGTPGISDPGFALVARVQEWNKNFKPVVQERSCTTGFIPMEVIPGPRRSSPPSPAAVSPSINFSTLDFYRSRKGGKASSNPL